jgi:nicotinate phosphoribosyltransferase
MMQRLFPYAESLALHTDLYQLTMAYGYWKKKIDQREAVFQLFFRKLPFNGSLAICAGLEQVVEYMQALRFSKEDLDYLGSLQLFDKEFLEFLSALTITCDLDAIPEGTPVFPQEPLLRVQGPLLQAQMLESAILNIVNFQTLIATKAARIVSAAQEDPVIEFGLRRAQGIDGAFSATRAAFIGGAVGTSNVLAAKALSIPLRGTFAHSWVMAFAREEEAFELYGELFPKNAIFLIDTYDTIPALYKAIRVAKRLRHRGFEMSGVRIDSGDLAELSIEIRSILDREGFQNAKIMASSELDETRIRQLKERGAKIDLWGVGTNLVTGGNQSACDGVYKLSAMRDLQGRWQQKLKISQQNEKRTNPGILQVRRFASRDRYIGDMLYDMIKEVPSGYEIVPFGSKAAQKIGEYDHSTDLLEPILRHGKRVRPPTLLSAIQGYSKKEQSRFCENPERYLLSLERSLFDTKEELIEEMLNR